MATPTRPDTRLNYISDATFPFLMSRLINQRTATNRRHRCDMAAEIEACSRLVPTQRQFIGASGKCSRRAVDNFWSFVAYRVATSDAQVHAFINRSYYLYIYIKEGKRPFPFKCLKKNATLSFRNR